MGDYATKIDEDGKTKWASSDGRMYATRSGAWKRSKKLEGEAKPKANPPKERPTPTADAEPMPERESPDWATFDYDGEDVATEFVPAVLKQIKPTSGPQTKRTKKQVEAAQQTSMAILGVGYRTMDVVLTKYKRAVLQDKEAEAIKHADEDIEWISEITNDGLVHSGIHIADAFSPVQIAVLCNGVWFGRPIYAINSRAKRRPFAGAGRFLERLPLIGRRLRARREAAEEVESREFVEVVPP